MRRTLTAILAVGLVAAAPLAHAAGTKVGLVDWQSVLQQSKAGQEVQQQMQTFGKQLQAQEQKAQAKLKKEQQQFKNNASIEKPAQQKQDKKKFQQDVQAYRQAQQQRRQQFQRKRAQLLEPLQASLENVIQKFAKQNGYDLILDKSAAVYNADAMDVTSAVLKAFDAAQPHAPAPDTSIGAQALQGSGHPLTGGPGGH